MAPESASRASPAPPAEPSPHASPARLQLVALPDLPLVRPGDDIAALVRDGARRAGTGLADGDVLVIAQKIVSKAEDRYVDLRDVVPSARAEELAVATDKDPRAVELILREARAVVRHRPGVIVVEHRLGVILANAGIDHSNVEQQDGSERVLLLPLDPDAFCTGLRRALREEDGVEVAVIVNDSVGRPWRHGTVSIAIGSAGLPPLMDLRGDIDLFGRPLRSSQVGLADQLASAGALVQGEAAEGRPVALIRGFPMGGEEAGAASLLRPAEEDLFR